MAKQRWRLLCPGERDCLQKRGRCYVLCEPAPLSLLEALLWVPATESRSIKELLVSATADRGQAPAVAHAQYTKLSKKNVVAASTSPEKETGVASDEDIELSRNCSYGVEYKKLSLFSLQREGLAGVVQTLSNT